jgi:hypothetical protein
VLASQINSAIEERAVTPFVGLESGVMKEAKPIDMALYFVDYQKRGQRAVISIWLADNGITLHKVHLYQERQCV